MPTFEIDSPYRPGALTAPSVDPGPVVEPVADEIDYDLSESKDQGVTLAFRVPTAMSMAIDVASRTVGQNRSQWLREAVAFRLHAHRQALRDGVQFDGPPAP